ncbi:unnamed protein product [Caenorhabditis auriculariae]|uniref:Uncharacterized protein n=1 Tax=Caenorhabditis auriculariae TaxID=2777116 RepID=A0A8S1H8G6_9PELO|nr:unnamed protein product [Caenorhabditis auriculariae]
MSVKRRKSAVSMNPDFVPEFGGCSHVTFSSSMDYLSIHDDDTSIASSDKTLERGFSRSARKRFPFGVVD